MKFRGFIVCLLALLLVVPFGVDAKTLSDVRAELRELEKDKAAAENKSAELQKEIDNAKAEINEITRQTADAIKKQNETKDDIKELEGEIDSKEEEIKDLVSFYQISDSENFYLKFIFGAESFEDFIYRFSVAEQLTEANDRLVDEMNSLIKKNEKKILSFPYLNEQKDLHFILWALISRMIWGFECKINDILKEKHFADITPVKRDFTCVAIAYTDDQHPAFNFYGCDDIDATSISGYKWVLASNIYGDRIEKHFECGHNFSRDEKLLMTLQSIGGISVNKLTESEKEVAAKAIECGYLRKNGDTIEPDIIVINQKDLIDFYDFAYAFNDDTMDISEQIADELAAFMKKHIPEHLMNEYPVYTSLIAGIRILSNAIEECISEGLLIPPANRTGAEGILMAVQK